MTVRDHRADAECRRAADDRPDIARVLHPFQQYKRAVALQRWERNLGSNAGRGFGVRDGSKHRWCHDRRRDFQLEGGHFGPRKAGFGTKDSQGLDAGLHRGGEEVRTFDDEAALGAPQTRVADQLGPTLDLGVVPGADQARLPRSSLRALRSISSTRSTCGAASGVERTSA